MARQTILLDFDGVIRHWSSSEIDFAERDCGLESGVLFSIAFSNDFLEPAVTGVISNDAWVSKVNQRLENQYGKSAAERLISAWFHTNWEIDRSLLENIKLAAPKCKIVLVTNATSKLASDLAASRLVTEFDLVVNSSDIGYAKPDTRYFQKALSLSKCAAKQAIFIDDSISNVSSAMSLGIESLQHKCSSETLAFVAKHCA